MIEAAKIINRQRGTSIMFSSVYISLSKFMRINSKMAIASVGC